MDKYDNTMAIKWLVIPIGNYPKDGEEVKNTVSFFCLNPQILSDDCW